MANQFNRRGPKDRIKTGHDEATKDKIRAEVLAKRLLKYAKAKGKQIEKYRMEPAQVQAAKVLIERGKPALQAIEQTTINELDTMTEEEIEDQVRSLILQHPGLIERLGIKPQLVSSQDPHSIAPESDIKAA